MSLVIVSARPLGAQKVLGPRGLYSRVRMVSINISDVRCCALENSSYVLMC